MDENSRNLQNLLVSQKFLPQGNAFNKIDDFSQSQIRISNRCAVWKVSKYGVISGLYFPVFGLNTEKDGPEITPYLDAFHAVMIIEQQTVSSKKKWMREKFKKKLIAILELVGPYHSNVSSDNSRNLSEKWWF